MGLVSGFCIIKDTVSGCTVLFEHCTALDLVGFPRQPFHQIALLTYLTHSWNWQDLSIVSAIYLFFLQRADMYIDLS
jgi:hypothetical protein